ncbi:MAG: phosphate acyltransferase PlsX [Oscillospiraceae bacterium]|nr:phosphate acyltransferase PlsX [Oscillospiraceae bacterium]
MRIVIDTMGSDLGCGEIVSGALDAVRELGVDVTLVGDAALIRPVVEASKLDAEIVDCPETVTMEDDPISVRSGKKGCSMVTAFKLLRDGKADAAVTAGSTGAAITAATLYVHRIRGVRRAALATVMPVNGGVILVDSGANVDCTPEFLLQFAYMGSFYAHSVFSKPEPRAGLLNIGAEDTKGDELHLAAHKLLSEAEGLRFVGNVEARYVTADACDVIVADGFSGNVMLKSMEGVGKFFSAELKKQLSSSLISKLGGLMVRDKLYALKKLMDYREVGGAPLIGISAPVIKAHGSSNARAIKNACRQAKLYTEGHVIPDIAACIDRMKVEA